MDDPVYGMEQAREARTRAEGKLELARERIKECQATWKARVAELESIVARGGSKPQDDEDESVVGSRPE